MKDKILMIIIQILVLSFFMIPASYALYRSITNSNNSIATAEWNVVLNESQDNNYMSVIAGDSTSIASYTINITSKSEVDIIYSIVIDNLPSGVAISLDNGEFIEEVNNKVIFADVSTINYSDTNKTKSHTLTFKALSNAEYVNNEEVNINVIARQTLAS
ncbi:MAG: hypothetical protein IJ097_02260 [Bacilli bacterium]|nr:hypothetical protein [Bacilli bacterium]